MAGEQEEHHHHHHHHHHHSSSSPSQGGSNSSPFVKVADIGDYSVRSFGRKSQTGRNPLPEGALSLIMCSVTVTALVIAPVVIKLVFSNKALTASNDQLRARLGTLMARLEEKGGDDNVAVKPKARYIEEETPAAEEPTENSPAAPAASDAPPPSAPHSLDAIASALGIDKKDLAVLKAEMEIFPNGMRYEIDDKGEDALVPDPLERNISNAVTLLFLDQRRDAASILRMASSAKPLWPYAHFLLGVAAGESAELERANLLFSAARAVGALPPEGELYRAACSLFLGSNAQAEAAIDHVSLADHEGRDLQIGPIPVPDGAPAHILDALRKACGADNIRKVEW